MIAIHFRSGATGRWQFVGLAGSWEEAQGLITEAGTWRLTRLSPSPASEAKALLWRFRKAVRRGM